MLDGEVTTIDREGRTDFELIQSRRHLRRPTPALIASAPVTFFIFDLLHYDTPMLDWAYDQRREHLFSRR